MEYEYWITIVWDDGELEEFPVLETWLYTVLSHIGVMFTSHGFIEGENHLMEWRPL